MDAATQSAAELRKQIEATEEQLKRLKEQLARVDDSDSVQEALHGLKLDGHVTVNNGRWPLSQEEYRRYGRQMIVPSIGILGQLRLKNARVLIVGAGGLGCPAAAYISGAGVGTVGIVDGDVVELSNLHRQILHSTVKVGMKKVDSAIEYLKGLNPNTTYIPHTEHLSPQNAKGIVEQYDLILDCTDHPTSRYLVSDICVLLQKPLVSASALRTDGQLIVLNSPPLPPGNQAGGPCYRCVFPKPPPAESVVSCGDGGILGPVVGIMGVLQALEAVRLIAQDKLTAHEKNEEAPDAGKVNGTETAATMLLFSANGTPPFRSVRLRSRRPKCFACSADRGLTLESLSSGSLDYVLFCGVAAPVNILRAEERIEARDYEKVREENKPHLLVDVREKVQFDICNIEGSINIPFSIFQGNKALLDKEEPTWLPEGLPPDAPIFIVCRLGNDSQVIARKLKKSGMDKGGRYIGDIADGLKGWQKQVDHSWPEY